MTARFLFSMFVCVLASVCLPTREAAGKVRVTVTDLTGLETRRPVFGGVPLAAGAASPDATFSLTNEAGAIVPCQAKALARWKDDSVRWLLLDFHAAPPPRGTAEFTLDWNDPPGGSVSPQPDRSANSSNKVEQTVSFGKKSAAGEVLRVSDRFALKFVLTDAEGQRCEGVTLSSDLETSGPVRSTWLLNGEFRRADETRVLGFQLRVSAFAGSSVFRLEPHLLVDSDSGVVHRIQDLSLSLVALTPIKRFSLSGHTPEPSETPVRLMQLDDETYKVEGLSAAGSKAPGWAEMTDSRGTVAIAVRNFWQQWPKSLEANENGLTIGLFPRFAAGSFEHMGPWYKHQYLFEDNCYQLRTGQSRRWQIWLDMDGAGAALAKSANAPLIAAADPAQAIATGVWGPIAAAGSPGMDAYDRWADNLFVNGYVNSIAQQRDYGAMNWGDWWGERGCNWGNHEYDTPEQVLIQFARTGDPKYLYLGDTAAHHTSEVDVIQFVNEDLAQYFADTVGLRAEYPIRPGMVHQHCVGHVSGFYSADQIRELYVSLGIGKNERPYICTDPYNLGHIWTQGMVYDYFLTGDPWMRQTVEKIGENLAQLVEERKFAFKGHSHCGRVNGWTMLAIAGAYELDFDPRYLKAMKLLADDALSEQDPETGGWRYKLPWGHCYCDSKHWGEAAFIGAVRINGLSKYYQLTEDARIPEAVRRGVTQMNRETWVNEHSGWRYTSCPKSASGPGRQTGVIVKALVNSVTLTGESEHLKILRQAWDAKFEGLLAAPKAGPGFGKTYSTIMYGCPEAMHLFIDDTVD